MKRISAWVVAFGTFLIGGTAAAQMPGPYYPPAGMPYPNPAPYGYPGYPPMPYGAPPNGNYYPGMPPSYGPGAMPYGNANPRGMPSPYSPTSTQPALPPGMLPALPPPSGMPYGNSNPYGIPQPFSPNGGVQGGNPATPPVPLGSGSLPFSFPNPPQPPGGGMGVPPFPPAPTQVPPKSGGTFPPQPTPLPPASQTQPAFPPLPTPLPNGIPPGKNGANQPGEPYLFPQEKLPPVPPDPRFDAPKPLPVVVEPEMRHDDLVSPVSYSPQAYIPPAEPYVLYEGLRSAAEVKQEVTCFWAQGSYIHWWIRRDSTPPLLATDSLATPGAAVLIGGGSIAPNEFSGAQASIGVWLDDEHNFGVELGGFWLGRNQRNYSVSSDAGGSPALVLPVVIGGAESGVSISIPGVVTGRMDVTSVVDFNGAELNFINNLLRVKGWSVDVLGGVRYLYLNDSLTMNESLGLPVGVVALNGVSATSLLLNDSFNVNNRFYGGQLGTRVGWTWQGFDIGVTGKFGIGATLHTVTIDGSTTATGAGGTVTVPGGVYALASNIGQYHRTDTSIVPELQLSVGYQLTPHIRLLAGYTALGWTNVYRAGTQVDRSVDQTQLPVSGLYVPGQVGTAPIFTGIRSGFWAQGLNVGVELRF